jgi:RHS repeat-associated protein
MVILPFFISTRFSGIKAISYGAFGNIITDTDPAFDIPFGFAGGLYDQNTKLVRFGCRDYDPDIGRWTAKDPILFAGGDTDLYGYCLNDPVNAVDPEGKFFFAPLVYFGAAKALAIGTAYLGFKLAQHIINSADPCEDKMSGRDINKAFIGVGLINAGEVV